MLRYKTETRPGLVALYDIRPGKRVNSYNPGAARGAHVTESGIWGVLCELFNNKIQNPSLHSFNRQK